MFGLSTIVLIILQVSQHTQATQWPIPYERSSNRPPNDPFCQALYTFCPNGTQSGTVPIFDSDDTIEVFAMKAPVWEFKYGSLLKILNIMHDAIGIRSKKTGLNYTLEWYELDQLLNCTFPHLLDNGELMWCNQGASCISPGIDDLHWSQNGTLVKVAEMTANQFKNYSDYILWDNKTGVYYETWTVRDKSKQNLWFEAHDCSTFVTDSFNQMAKFGVKFNKSVSLNYTIMELVTGEPTPLGNISVIKRKPKLHKDLLEFFSLFQTSKEKIKYVEHFIKVFFDLIVEKKFYLYYNYEYWLLHLEYPYVRLTYPNIPLP